jgi:hypothetical protein
MLPSLVPLFKLTVEVSTIDLKTAKTLGLAVSLHLQQFFASPCIAALRAVLVA